MRCKSEAAFRCCHFEPTLDEHEPEPTQCHGKRLSKEAKCHGCDFLSPLQYEFGVIGEYVEKILCACSNIILAEDMLLVGMGIWPCMARAAARGIATARGGDEGRSHWQKRSKLCIHTSAL